MLRREIGGIIAINPQGGKVARVNSISAYIESGNVFLPRTAHWINDFLNEASAFPNAKNDDQVDAMSQALNRFIYFAAELPESNKKPLPFPFQSNKENKDEYMSW